MTLKYIYQENLPKFSLNRVCNISIKFLENESTKEKKYRKSPISAVPWGKGKSALIESALIEFSNKNHEIWGKMAKKSTFLDNFACF